VIRPLGTAYYHGSALPRTMDALANQQLRTLNEFQSNAANHAYKFSAEELAARHQGILNDLAQRKMAKAGKEKKRDLQEDIGIDEAALQAKGIHKLLEGYKRFRDHDLGELEDKMRVLANEGQEPCAMVLSCCDSRADPALVFDAAPGDIFVMRNLMNTCPEYKAPDQNHHGTCAAIEYAVTALKVPLLMVMGHAQCASAARALAICAKSDALPADARFMDRWCFMAKDAVCTVIKKYDPQARGRELELENVRLSVARLMRYPWIRSAVDAGTLEVRGSFFTIFDGKLLLLAKDGSFYNADDGMDGLEPVRANLLSHPLK